MIFCQKSTKIYIHIMLCHADIISAGHSFTCLYRLSLASGLTGEWQYRDNIMFKTILKLIGSLFLLSPSKPPPTPSSSKSLISEISRNLLSFWVCARFLRRIPARCARMTLSEQPQNALRCLTCQRKGINRQLLRGLQSQHIGRFLVHVGEREFICAFF